ncbi:MAG: adenosylcobinamide-phosphate synthase CbiB [Prevotellaceae bacterium]|nr:adenosylcobinamide-phosphate synthase CbiB [Prevotellaceae bacterium]
MALYSLTSALLLGWLLDVAFGDPPRLPHPIVWFGRWIALWERRLNCGSCRRLRGALLAILSVLLVFSLTWLLVRLLRPFPPFCFAFQTLVVFFCLAGHTLRHEVRSVFVALRGSLAEGRASVARIVGRDTAALSANEVRTAALETLAENLSDGVVAPLFWLALLGVPGMLAYKMVNTLDSMIGYRTSRYRLFGCFAARLDDVVNYLPARLTALLIILVGWLIGLSSLPKQQRRSLAAHWRFVVSQGPRHLSPNSGWPEAALASLLDCRFGGSHSYFGEECPKPYIGIHERPLDEADLHFSLRVSFATELLAILLVCLSLKFR